MMEVPVPAEVVPQPPVNHCQVAPEPSAPPLTVKVAELPGQTLVGVAEAPAGTVEWVRTVTVT